MRTKILNNAAFSLLEVLLAAVIFVISVAGIFVTMNAVRGPVANKENQLTATVFGKQALEALYSQVEESSFYNNCSVGTVPCPDFSLSLGTHLATSVSENWPPGLSIPSALTSVNNGLAYTVSCADGSASPCTTPSIARRVDLNINWPQSS